MKSLNIFIIEDEILIAETIKIYLEERGHRVLNISISYEEATQAYFLRKPDLVLLDIRLYGEKSGIDFANFMTSQKELVPFIYLTSQYDQRILEHALKTNPYGYLTKPIHKQSLWTSIESAYNLYISKNVEEKIVFIQDGKYNYHIKANDILFIQADHVYSKIVTIDKQEITVRKTLQQVFEQFEVDFIIYCHRSYIINCKHITSWTSESIILKHNILVPISRSRRKEILELIDSFIL